MDLPTLAADARAHIVDLGAKLSGWGLRSANASDQASISEIGDTPGEITFDAPTYLFQFRLSANLSAPHVGLGPVRLFSSPSGERMIVSWAQADRLFYRSSQSDGSWSDPKQLIFSSNLDINKAYQILGQRLGNH